MAIVVEHEPADIVACPIQERCCFCREFTRYWAMNFDVACCQRCAGNADPMDLPTKEQWCRRERIARSKTPAELCSSI